jgi:hypothetical protein
MRGGGRCDQPRSRLELLEAVGGESGKAEEEERTGDGALEAAKVGDGTEEELAVPVRRDGRGWEVRRRYETRRDETGV